MQKDAIKDTIEKSQDFQELEREIFDGKISKSTLFISKDNAYSFELCKLVACRIFDGTFIKDSLHQQKVFADAHPDLKIYPTKDRLLVADSEDIVLESFVKPIFADRKVFIIKNIDEAMDSAQNKLLKILEEPPSNVYFLLTCSNIDKVLPTIRSRCNKKTLAKLSDGELAKIVKCDEDKLQLVLAVSDGLLGKAETLAKKRNFEQLCTDAVGVFTKLKTSKEVLEVSKTLQSYKDDFALICDIFNIILSDLLSIKAGKNELVKMRPFLAQLENAASGYTIRAICQISNLLNEVTKEKFYNVNQVLSLENFLLNVLEVKYLCK